MPESVRDPWVSWSITNIDAHAELMMVLTAEALACVLYRLSDGGWVLLDFREAACFEPTVVN